MIEKQKALLGLEEYANPLVSKKGKRKNIPVIANREITDNATGEVETITIIKKMVSSDYGFHKIWIEDLLNILNSFGNRKITILSHLLKIMRNDDNSMTFTMRGLSEVIGISTKTCQNTINELLAGNVIKRDKYVRQLYFFNPDLIFKGGSQKRKIMIEYYYEDESKDNNQDHKKIKQDIREIVNKDIIDVEAE